MGREWERLLLKCPCEMGKKVVGKSEKVDPDLG